MSGDDVTAPARTGSGADVSRRLDRLEQGHELLVRDVGTLAATVMRVETNQAHAVELNKLRFDALDNGIQNVRTDLSTFVSRINGIVAGEVKTPTIQQGEALVLDYQQWRKLTDGRLETIERDGVAAGANRNGRFETLGFGRSVILFGFALMGGLVAVVDILAKLTH